MKLILWRHAEAEIGTGDDLARTLTPKGHQQAQAAAEKINKILPKQAIICVSQASRSQQTAAYLQRPTHTLPELNPDVSAASLLPILQSYQTDDCVVLGWTSALDWRFGRVFAHGHMGERVG